MALLGTAAANTGSVHQIHLQETTATGMSHTTFTFTLKLTALVTLVPSIQCFYTIYVSMVKQLHMLSSRNSSAGHVYKCSVSEYQRIAVNWNISYVVPLQKEKMIILKYIAHVLLISTCLTLYIGIVKYVVCKSQIG